MPSDSDEYFETKCKDKQCAKSKNIQLIPLGEMLKQVVDVIVNLSFLYFDFKTEYISVYSHFFIILHMRLFLINR